MGTVIGPAFVEVLRGDRVESVHEIDLAVVSADGTVVMRAGRPEQAVFVRSAIKPFQALPLVADGVADRCGLTEEELAVCCASHSGERRHVELTRSILAKAGLDETALACGPHAPFSSEAAASLRSAGLEPQRIHNNCSGKHAGMLALATGHAWDPEGYQELEHPVQQRVLREIERWTGVARDRIGTGVDGCGVATFVLPLEALALAFARLAGAARDAGSPAARVLGAMRAHPFVVAGTNRLCTELGRATAGRIVAKVGAEGVYGAAVLDRGWGIALKARDGARRAAEMALMGLLEAAGLLTAEEAGPLEPWRRPVLRNTRGDRVGMIRMKIEAVDGG
jgi:L-asparaginase II